MNLGGNTLQEESLKQLSEADEKAEAARKYLSLRSDSELQDFDKTRQDKSKEDIVKFRSNIPLPDIPHEYDYLRAVSKTVLVMILMFMIMIVVTCMRLELSVLC